MALLKPRLADVEPIPAALTAATAVIELSPDSSWKTWKFGNTDWQREAWRLYDIVPELWKLAGRIGDSLAKARMYVAELDERGEEVGETKDARISALAGIPLGTGSQRDDALRLAGVDLAVGGECWIVGEGAAEMDPEKARGNWFVVTSSAFKRTGDVVKVRRPKIMGGRDLVLRDGVDILIRCWRPHPNDVDQPDSFSRSAIVPLREIELLTKREFAELDSRLTGAGVWLLPEGVDFPRDPQDPEGVAGFMQYLQRVTAASMRDQSTAAAMVPIMATVPQEVVEHLDKIQPINFWSDLSAEIGPMKEKAITRLASSAEVPPETLTGLGDVNHWSGWLISEEGIRWIGTYLGLVADALTRGFLRRALTVMGADPDRYAYAFDTSTLAAKPNRLEEAIQLHDRFLIRDEEVVKAGAFDAEQMPDVQQRAAQILLKAAMTQPDLLLDPAVQAILGLPAVQSVGLPATADQNTDGEDPDPEIESRDAPNGGTPPAPSENEARILDRALGERIAAMRALPAAPPSPEVVFNAACKLTVYRALELAGGRLTTPLERSQRGRWAGVPRHDLPSRVGPITPDHARKVTEGAWNHLGVIASDLGVDEADLRRLLENYVVELLTRGMPHHDDLLYAALNIAHQGRGMVAA